MLMIEPLPSRKKKLQAMSRPKLKAVVGLITGHTNLRAHMFKLGLAKWQDWQLCRDKKRRQCAYCMSLEMACNRQNLGLCVFETKDLETWG